MTGLTVFQKVGIALGVILGVAVVGGAAFFILRRIRGQKAAQQYRPIGYNPDVYDIQDDEELGAHL